MNAVQREYEVSFSEGALADAERLRTYLSDELGMPGAAHKAMEQVVAAAEGLVSFPLRNRVLARRKGGVELRRALAGNYMLLYTVTDLCVCILAVLHGNADVTSKIRAAFERLAR